jgi:CRP-like cAMP-binding protein
MIRKSETLARIPLFGSLTQAAVERLDTQCAWRRAKANEQILDYKDGGRDLYFVVHGHVRVLIQASSGRDSGNDPSV